MDGFGGEVGDLLLPAVFGVCDVPATVALISRAARASALQLQLADGLLARGASAAVAVGIATAGPWLDVRVSVARGK